MIPERLDQALQEKNELIQQSWIRRYGRTERSDESFTSSQKIIGRNHGFRAS